MEINSEVVKIQMGKKVESLPNSKLTLKIMCHLDESICSHFILNAHILMQLEDIMAAYHAIQVT